MALTGKTKGTVLLSDRARQRKPSLGFAVNGSEKEPLQEKFQADKDENNASDRLCPPLKGAAQPLSYHRAQQ